jgi:hypothetical protein
MLTSLNHTSDCVRPEISRAFNFGKDGVSQGQYYEDHLAKIKLNDKRVQFGGVDSYEEDPDRAGTAKKEEGAEGLDTGGTAEFRFDIRFLSKERYDPLFMIRVFERSSLFESSSELFDFLHQPVLPNDSRWARNLNLFSPKNPNVLLKMDDVDFKIPSRVNYCGPSCRRRFRVEYAVESDDPHRNLRPLLEQWGLMDDIRGGVPRTGYMGVIDTKVKVSFGDDEFVHIYFAPSERNLV